MFGNAIGIILYADEADYESLAITIVRSVPLWRCLSPHLFVRLPLPLCFDCHTNLQSSPPPRNARWYRWYRHRRCHSPSLFQAFVQRNKPIMPGLSGAGGSWGWVSLSRLIDLQTEQAIDMSEWLHDYTHWPFWVLTLVQSSTQLLPIFSSFCACVWSASRVPCPSWAKNDLIMNSNCSSSTRVLETVAPLTPNIVDSPIVCYFSIFFHFSIFPLLLLLFKRICTVKNRQQFHMQKTHKHTYWHIHRDNGTWVWKVVEPFDECQKGNWHYKRISRIWPIVANGSANLEVKVQTSHYALIGTIDV